MIFPFKYIGKIDYTNQSDLMQIRTDVYIHKVTVFTEGTFEYLIERLVRFYHNSSERDFCSVFITTWNIVSNLKNVHANLYVQYKALIVSAQLTPQCHGHYTCSISCFICAYFIPGYHITPFIISQTPKDKTIVSNDSNKLRKVHL